MKGPGRAVGMWLMGTAGLTWGMITVGGLTRLTESGLSMTDWRPQGSLPPMGEEQWQAEFSKYQEFPEYTQRDGQMELGEFKRIYYWEWGHRMLGRALGLVMGGGALYFAARRKLRGKLLAQCMGVFALGGAQGAVGWWMVKSGLGQDVLEENRVARVSHYRLAAHFGSALTIYSSLIWLGLNVLRTAPVSPLAVPAWFGAATFGVCGMIFTTALSGALVAGLDAGLVYNTWPLMGGDFFPDGRTDLTSLDDDVIVQFNHRWLGAATATACGALWYSARHLPLPRSSRVFLNVLAGLAGAQAALGITTLVNFVPVPLAATHQAGSVALLTVGLHLLHDLKRLR